MTESNADARCPECGAQEPHWDGSRSDPDCYRTEIDRLRAALDKIAGICLGSDRGDVAAGKIHGIACRALAFEQTGQK